MADYILESRVWLARTRAEVFAFFAAAENLIKLTPPSWRLEIVAGPRSIKDRHLSMTFNQDGRRFRAIAWRAAEQAEFLDQHRAGVNLAFSLDRNEYQGETYLELSVADIKALE